MNLHDFHFNSIVVRLEPSIELKGRIKKHVFQFHNGEIRTLIPMGKILFFPNFNSMKVRLEVERIEQQTTKTNFQFQ